MQFPLVKVFLGLGMFALLLATLSAGTWRLSLIWLIAAMFLSLAKTALEARHDKNWERALVHLLGVLAIIPWGAVAGFIGGIVIYNCTGWFSGYPQSNFAGIAALQMLGFYFPRFLELAAILPFPVP